MLDLFDYMVAAGFRKIGLISFPLNSTDNIDRYKAFAEAHRRNNIALDKNRIEIMESVDWTGEGCSFEAAERLIQKNIDFDAMIYSQAGIMRCLLPVSKKYPGHILPSLPAGVFDYNFTGEFPTVAASVVQPIREIAGKAVDLIFTGPPLSGKHRQAMLPMRLVTKREIYKTFSDVTAVNIK
jgi:DNA-binding LacI/PurR family transcriptional regulator